MARSGAEPPPAPDGERRARVVVSGASTIDPLLPVLVARVADALPVDATTIRVAVTSLAPGEPAARAARQISRLVAQRGLAATLVDSATPSSSTATASTVNRGRAVHRALAWPSHMIRSLDDAMRWHPIVNVNVVGLDLSPTLAAVDQTYAVGLWLQLEPRSRRFRRQLAAETDRQVIDAAIAAGPVATIVVARHPGLAIGLAGTDLLAVEVLARALRSAMQPVGDLGLSPWQAPVVQRGIELGAGVTHPDRIDVESVWLGNPDAPGHDRLHRIVEVATARSGIGRAATVG